MNRKHLLLSIAAMTLASPLVLAQSTNQAPPAPATPAIPAVPSDKDKDKSPVDTPSTDDTGMTRAGAHTKGGRANAAANPNSGHASGSGAGESDFAAFDGNGDGKLSQDELTANTEMSGRFKQLDKNHDGSLSRGEYEAGLHAKNPASGNTDTPKRVPGQ